MLRDLIAADAAPPGIELATAIGPFRARVVVGDGVIWACAVGPSRGTDALFRLLLAPRTAVSQTPLPAAPSGEALGRIADVLAAFDAFAEDLAARAARVGGLDRVWAVRFAALKTILEGLPEDVKRLIRLCDSSRDVRRLIVEGPLPALTTLAVLDKLLRQGVLVRGDLDDDLAVRAAADDDGAVDRRWQGARATPPSPALVSDAASPAPTPPTEEKGPAPVASAVSAPAAQPPAPTSTTSTTAATPVQATATPATTTAPPAPATVAVAVAKATTTAPTLSKPELLDEPVILEARRSEPSTFASLPKCPPKPRADLTAWLGEEESFFQGAAPQPTTSPWPVWQLVALAAVGAVIGGVVAHACA